jgi:hypothetical protein
MTGGIGEAMNGTYFLSQRRKHYLVCSCGWKLEIIYGFGTDITFKEFWEKANEHKKECEVFKKNKKK